MSFHKYFILKSFFKMYFNLKKIGGGGGAWELGKGMVTGPLEGLQRAELIQQ